MDKQTMAEILREAADRLEQQPIHVQGMGVSNTADGTLCFCAGSMIGVILLEKNLATSSYSYPYPFFSKFYYSPFATLFGVTKWVLPDYNDSRSKPETVALLRSKADELLGKI